MEKITFVLTAGTGMNGKNFPDILEKSLREQAKSYLQVEADVIYADLLGHTDFSGYPDGTSVKELAEDLAAKIKNIPGRVCVLAHSLAATVLLYAAIHRLISKEVICFYINGADEYTALKDPAEKEAVWQNVENVLKFFGATEAQLKVAEKDYVIDCEISLTESLLENGIDGKAFFFSGLQDPIAKPHYFDRIARILGNSAIIEKVEAGHDYPFVEAESLSYKVAVAVDLVISGSIDELAG